MVATDDEEILKSEVQKQMMKKKKTAAAATAARRKEQRRSEASAGGGGFVGASRFRIVGMVVRAVQRMSASLNPTVEFRKRNSPADMFSAAVGIGPNRQMSAPLVETCRAKSGLGALRKVRSQRSTRGHMMDYLLQPLPQVQDGRSA